jgi:predicted KAP-like P-loop ATPase
LIALEVLRLFEPDVYARLPNLKEVLTTKHEAKSAFFIDPDVAKRTVVELVQSVSGDRRGHIEQLLKNLFPHTAWIFGGSGFDDSDDRWFRELRVCSEDVFSRYFQLATPIGDISQARIEQIIASIESREAFVSELRALKAEGILETALDRLDSYKRELDLAHALPLVTAIFDFGDELPARRPQLFEVSPDTRAIRIVFWHLRGEPDLQKRCDILKEAIRDTIGLYLPVKQIKSEVDAHKEGDHEARLVEDVRALESLQRVCVDRIKQWAEDGRLSASPVGCVNSACVK